MYKIKNFFNNKNLIINELILFSLITIFFFLQIKQYLFEENFKISILYVYSFLLFILLLEIIIISRLVKTNFFSSSIFKRQFIYFFLIFVNFYSLILSNSFEFTMMNGQNKIFEVLKYFFIILIVNYIFFINSNTIKKISIIFIIFNLIYLFNLNSIIMKFNEPKYFENNEYIFEKKPNIYIFSFETLAPLSLTKKHLNIDSRYFYNHIKNKVLVLKNNFSDNIPTSNALNSFIFLDQQKYRDLDRKTSGSFFAGRKLSETFRILKNNNYRIVTGFHNSTFGSPGKYVDNYLTFRSIKSEDNKSIQAYPQFCQFKMPWYHFQLFIYCDLFSLVFNIDDNFKLNKSKNYHEYLINLINENNKPKFMFFHIYKTVHPTPGIKDFENFYEDELNKVFNYMEKIIKKLETDDPNSLLILIGDHSHLIFKWSKNENLKKNIENLYENKSQAKILDQYPAFAAIHDPKSICTKNIENLIKKNFSTNSMILNHILGCLTGTEKMLFKNLKYNLPNGERYLDYIYE